MDITATIKINKNQLTCKEVDPRATWAIFQPKFEKQKKNTL